MHARRPAHPAQVPGGGASGSAACRSASSRATVWPRAPGSSAGEAATPNRTNPSGFCAPRTSTRRPTGTRARLPAAPSTPRRGAGVRVARAVAALLREKRRPSRRSGHGAADFSMAPRPPQKRKAGELPLGHHHPAVLPELPGEFGQQVTVPPRLVVGGQHRAARRQRPGHEHPGEVRAQAAANAAAHHVARPVLPNGHAAPPAPAAPPASSPRG